MLSWLFSFLLALLALGVIILFHELGHLIAALLMRVKVSSFSVGFGPPLIEHTRWGIHWQLARWPLGGYVLLADDGVDKPFARLHQLKLLLVFAMGPLASMLLSLGALQLLHSSGGRQVPFHAFMQHYVQSHGAPETTAAARLWIDPILADYPQAQELFSFGKVRLMAVDGELCSSRLQVSEVVKQRYVWFTVQRGESQLLVRCKSYPIEELPLTAAQQLALSDWAYQEQLPFRGSRWIPYDVDERCRVQSCLLDSLEGLQPGDLLLNLRGRPCTSLGELFSALQRPEVTLHLGVEMDPSPAPAETVLTRWRQELADPQLKELFNLPFGKPLERHGPWLRVAHLPLKPLCQVIPEEFSRFKEYLEKRGESERLEQLQREGDSPSLPAKLCDTIVIENLPPLEALTRQLSLILGSFRGLFNVQRSRQHLSGPLGIISTLTLSFHQDPATALLMISMVSLNLAVFNLIPLPLLDGGQIFLGVIQLLRGRRLSFALSTALMWMTVVLLLGITLSSLYWDLTSLLGAVIY